MKFTVTVAAGMTAGLTAIALAMTTAAEAGVARVRMAGMNVVLPGRVCDHQAALVDAVYGANAYSAVNRTRIICNSASGSGMAWVIDGEAASFDETHVYYRYGTFYSDCILDQASSDLICANAIDFTRVYVTLESPGSIENLAPLPHADIRLEPPLYGAEP
jgi:hypothetical protein